MDVNTIGWVRCRAVGLLPKLKRQKDGTEASEMVVCALEDCTYDFMEMRKDPGGSKYWYGKRVGRIPLNCVIYWASLPDVTKARD